jgi:MOSC domain-containing protein YiiM
VVSVNVSLGGKPKTPIARGVLTPGGFEGDGRDHAKHYKPDRAVSLIDAEIFAQMSEGGEPVGPGSLGENLTLREVNVRNMAVGTRLRIAGGVEVALTEPHKPCTMPDGTQVVFVGYMARVLTPGEILPGASVTVVPAAEEAE